MWFSYRLRAVEPVSINLRGRLSLDRIQLLIDGTQPMKWGVGQLQMRLQPVGLHSENPCRWRHMDKSSSARTHRSPD